MIDFGVITAAVKALLKTSLPEYAIYRNAPRNGDPNLAARGSGWINITRGRIDYTAHSVGLTPWLAQIETRVEVQVASFKSDEDAEDKLQDAEKAIMDVLTANKKLGNTVDTTTGYRIDYEFNPQERIWHHAAIIIIISEVRTG